MYNEIRYKHLSEEWIEICKQMQVLQKRRVKIYEEAESIKPGQIVLKIERSPSIYKDFNNEDINI